MHRRAGPADRFKRAKVLKDWQMAVLIVAAIGLLWLWLKNRK